MKAEFSKCGIIKEDPVSHDPKIKLYRDKATGFLKGDGLVTYLKVHTNLPTNTFLTANTIMDHLYSGCDIAEGRICRIDETCYANYRCLYKGCVQTKGAFTKG